MTDEELSSVICAEARRNRSIIGAREKINKHYGA